MYGTLLLLHILGATVWTGGHLIVALTILPRALKRKAPAELLRFESAYERIGTPPYSGRHRPLACLSNGSGCISMACIRRSGIAPGRHQACSPGAYNGLCSRCPLEDHSTTIGGKSHLAGMAHYSCHCHFSSVCRGRRFIQVRVVLLSQTTACTGRRFSPRPNRCAGSPQASPILY